mmetsp:Transcript_14964/g.40177  ORF Transcript_14964/g.40177 Transcript_14964/m.40177 type:complete len:201 (+) Transcript_14964:3-605(+)
MFREGSGFLESSCMIGDHAEIRHIATLSFRTTEGINHGFVDSINFGSPRNTSNSPNVSMAAQRAESTLAGSLETLMAQLNSEMEQRFQAWLQKFDDQVAALGQNTEGMRILTENMLRVQIPSPPACCSLPLDCRPTKTSCAGLRKPTSLLAPCMTPNPTNGLIWPPPEILRQEAQAHGLQSEQLLQSAEMSSAEVGLPNS